MASAKKRDVLVTITPLVAGNFTKHRGETKLFILSHEIGEYKVVVNDMVKFWPKPGHTDNSIGIVSSNKARTRITIKHHDDARKS